MSKPQVMVMSTVYPSALANLEAQFDLLRWDQAEDRGAFLRSNGKNCRVVILNGHVPLGENELKHLPSLELVACTSAGFEAIDLEQLSRAGIALTNASQALRDDVADAVLMLLLATYRNLVQCDAYVRTGQWGQDGPYPLLSTLKGKRAGILGFGTIGQEIAARLTPMKNSKSGTVRGVKRTSGSPISQTLNRSPSGVTSLSWWFRAVKTPVIWLGGTF